MTERHLMVERMGELLNRAFLRIRSQAWNEQESESGKVNEEIADLADLLHNIPRWMVGHDEQCLVSMDQIRTAFVGHVRRFYPKANPDEHEYIRILSMSDEEFEERYPRQTAWLTETETVHA
ncbi:MAG: hypothetical protein U0798_01750 [Gemmataceae bacterium]